MCGACHREEDRDFPSTLKLEEDCHDCHNLVEFPDVEWVKDNPREVRLSLNAPEGITAEELATVRRVMRQDLGKYSFTVLENPTEDLITVMLTLRVRELPETRFVPPGCTVIRGEIFTRVTRPGIEEYGVRRKTRSRPEWGRTAKEARLRALLDAWAVLLPHLLEALAIG